MQQKMFTYFEGVICNKTWNTHFEGEICSPHLEFTRWARKHSLVYRGDKASWRLFEV